MRVSVRKLHAAGNTYAIVNSAWTSIDDLAWCARSICRRRLGLDADGLVYLTHQGGARFALQVRNADGSLSRLNGNALRCAARYIFEDYRYRAMLLTQNGRTCPAEVDGDDVAIDLTVDSLGRVGPRDAGHRSCQAAIGDALWTVVWTPGEQPQERDLSTGTTEHGEAEANTCWVAASCGRLTVATVERGVVGQSGSSATGAVAAVAVGPAFGHRLPDRVRVVSPGGELVVHRHSTGARFRVEGRVEHILVGDYDLPALRSDGAPAGRDTDPGGVLTGS
ncbi:MAG TPA: hypothetical protein VE547_08855 [Mycobacteriales bacterium]|nr:hypothetical protein [Mycobacteriales bacterium]